jgi:hypothetical protein
VAGVQAAGISVGIGGISVGVGVGGGDGSVASVGVGAGDSSTTVAVTTNDGDLAAIDSDGTTTDAAVNLGDATDTVNDLLGNLDVTVSVPPGTPPGGGGGGGDGGLGGAFAQLGAGEQRAVEVKCRSVLASPRSYGGKLVALCRMIARL